MPRTALVALSQTFSGPLPSAVYSFTVTGSGSTVLVLAEGSCQVNLIGIISAINVNLDGAADPVQMQLYQNALNTHRTMVPAVIQRTNLALGQHTVQLVVASVNVVPDANDAFRILIMEYTAA